MFRGDRLEAIKINQKRKKTSTLSNLITIICLGIFFYSLFQLSNIAWDYYDNRKNMGEAREIYYQDEDKVSASHGETRPQFHSLLGMNRDITGWIRLDDTPIDYPILQARDNNYYLDKNYKKQSTRAGSIFMDFRNNVELGSRNTILYGHDMKDGSMFGNLKNIFRSIFSINTGCSTMIHCMKVTKPRYSQCTGQQPTFIISRLILAARPNMLLL